MAREWDRKSLSQLRKAYLESLDYALDYTEHSIHLLKNEWPKTNKAKIEMINRVADIQEGTAESIRKVAFIDKNKRSLNK